MQQTVILTLIFLATLPWGDLDSKSYVVRRNAAQLIEREATVQQLEDKLKEPNLSVETKSTIRFMLPTVKKREFKIHVEDRTVTRQMMIRTPDYFTFATNGKAPDADRYQKMLADGASPEEVLMLAIKEHPKVDWAIRIYDYKVLVRGD